MTKVDVRKISPRAVDAMRRSGQWDTMLRDVNASAAYNPTRVYRAESWWAGQVWQVVVRSRLPVLGPSDVVEGIYYVRK